MNPEIEKHLAIATEIIRNNASAIEQVLEFERRTGKKRATFFRYKRFLSGDEEALTTSPYVRELKRYTKEFRCHFCGTSKDLLGHHKDGNHDNNDIENLLALCKSCHQKLHLILRTDAEYWCSHIRKKQ